MKALAPGTKHRIYGMPFAAIHQAYINKLERKDRTQADADAAILWLTGHTKASLRKAIDSGIDLETFFAKAPKYNPKSALITGVVCGVRVEDIPDETMKRIRQLDKLIDELAKGRPMEKVLRA